MQFSAPATFQGRLQLDLKMQLRASVLAHLKTRMHISPAEGRTFWPVLEALWKSRCGLQEFTVTCLVLMVRVKGWEM